MDLSNDLISQFVKITNDDKKKSSESTVYGTVVEYNGGMYVKIDGSDLLTPVETTADFKADERVTVMIKNHSATVTGNITSPAANEGTVTEKVTQKVTEAVEDVEGKVITEVEILIADRVSTEQLDAEVARIDTLIAGKATIEDLEAIDAKIENLEVENLDAINAEIENLKATKAEIGDLKATNATIEHLDAEFADIKTLVNGNLTSDNILSFNITADKVTMEDAFIKDAMIDNVSANKINAGTINTNNVNIQSEDGSLVINGSTQQFKDDNGNVRIQIGKDATGDFTFALYGEDGKGQLINQNGITASAIGDGLIVNDMVADNAAISGGKLDISSVITEINNDGSTSLKSSKVYLDDKGQTLEVAFDNLTTKVDTIKNEDLTKLTEQVTSNATQIEVNEGKIESLVLEDSVIKEQVTNLSGDIVEVNNTLTNKYSKMEQDLSGFKTSVNDTYATKKSVTDLDTKLTTNYSTTSAMNSAIEQKAGQITSSISSTYATKSETQNLQGQIADTQASIDNLEIGGRNLVSWSDPWETSTDYGFAHRGLTTPLEPGQTYTLTINGRVNANTAGRGLVVFINDPDWIFAALAEIWSTTDTTASTTFTIPEDISVDTYYGVTAYYYPYSEDDGGGSATINWYKVEKGTKSTDWTPAPEDIQADLNNTKDNLANNYSTTTTMNSIIDQKANDITSSVSATYATKQSVTDVNNKFNNYSTTTQMNSAIQQKANEINQTVSETYTTKSEFDNLEIGGTNLMRYSKPYLLNGKTNIWRGNVSWKPDSQFYGGKEDVFWNSTTATTETWVEQVTSWGPDVTQGKTYTISFDYTRGSYSKGLRVQIYDQNDNDKATLMNEGTEISANVVQHREIIWTATYTGKLNLCFWNKGSATEGTNANVLFSSIKIEEGNKATAWSPAPQDIQSQIDDTNTNLTVNYTTKSEFSQTTDSITAKFTESGGYNLVRNGGFIFGMNNWSYTSAYLSRGASLYTASGYYIDVTQPYQVKGEPIKIQSGKIYIYSAKVWYTANTSMGWYSPLNYITTASSSGTTHEDGFIEYIAKSHNTIPKGDWVDIWVVFKCSKPGYYHPHLLHEGITSVVSFADVMIMEGDVYKPWTPHPYEVYDGVTTIDKKGITVTQSNYGGYTQMSASGFYVNDGSKDVVTVDSNGLYVQGNITSGSTIQGARITGSTFNSSNDVFQVLEDGTIETSFLAVNGSVSTDKLNVNEIENAAYPKALYEATIVYIDPIGGTNAETFYDGAYFASIHDMLAVAPRNLNGYTLTIRMMGDVYENAAFSWFHSGQVNFEMQGYTLYGYFYGYGPSMVYRMYGNTSSNNNGTWGHIKPNTGRSLGSYYYDIQFQYCQFAVNYIAVYPSGSSGSSSGGLVTHRGATGVVFNMKVCGDMRYLARAEYASRIHVNSSEGVCNNATFCATTGGIITLNTTNTQAGRSTTGNPYWVGTGGLILADQMLGMDKVTFTNTAQPGSGSSSGSTSRTVTETVKASSADTYRTTVYVGWKGDGTCRQGDYGYGDCQGCWFFGNNLYNVMNSGTVSKVVIKFTRQAGGVHAAQTLTIKSHNHTSKPSGAPTYKNTIGTVSVAVGGTATLTITNSTILGYLKSCKGLGLSIGSTSSPYAVCSGSCSVAVTYTTTD